jgi:TonB family protein
LLNRSQLFATPPFLEGPIEMVHFFRVGAVAGVAAVLAAGALSDGARAADKYLDKTTCSQNWQFADFPDEAIFVARHQGSVSVLIYASETGHVDDVKVVSSSGDPRLVDDVTRGVRKFSHNVPAQCSGRPVASISPYSLDVTIHRSDK